MLGGSDDGQPSVRPRRPPRGGGHWPAWPPWGLSRPHPRPPRPGHRRHLGEGVQEPSHYDTGSPILEESPHPNGQQTPLPISQVRKLLFLFTTNISARAPLNIKPQQSTRAHAGRRGGEAEAGLQESVQVNMIFSFDNVPELIHSLFRGIAKELNTFWRKNDKYKPSTQRNCQYFCQRDDQQKIVSFVWKSNCGV